MHKHWGLQVNCRAAEIAATVLMFVQRFRLHYLKEN